jgi:hypothetical protein
VVNDPDAIWKPGYDGPPPIPGATRERADAHRPADAYRPARADSAEHDEPARIVRPRRRRHVVVVPGLALVMAAAFVVLDPLGSRDASSADDAADASDEDRRADEGAAVDGSVPVIERPDVSVFGGPAARRLPGDGATLWSVDIGHDGDHWVEVIRRDLVLVAVAGPSGPSVDADATVPSVTTIVALDAPTGEQRWTLPIVGHLRDVSVIGAVDDVLVLEQPGEVGPSVTGVDVATGQTLWSADAAPSGGHVGLIGTPFIAGLPSSPDRFVSLIEATSGRDVGTIVSNPAAPGHPGGWSTDGRGTWWVIDDDGVVVGYDLSVGFGEASVVGRVDDVSRPHIVVDGRVAGVDDAGSITIDEADASTVEAEVPVQIRSLTPVSDSTFVVSAPGSIAGVDVQGDVVDVSWSRREGVVMDHHPVVGGSIIQLATRGGAAMELVDGLTGEAIEHLTMMPGVLQALVVAGDGAVVLRTSDFGRRLAGIGLDGTERWSVPGSAPVVIGDRIAVRVTSDEMVDADAATSMRQLRITAYGDADGE